ERTVDTGLKTRGTAPLAGLAGLYIGRALWAWGGWSAGPIVGGFPVVPAVAGAFAVCALLKLLRLGAAGPRWAPGKLYASHPLRLSLSASHPWRLSCGGGPARSSPPRARAGGRGSGARCRRTRSPCGPRARRRRRAVGRADPAPARRRGAGARGPRPPRCAG